MATPGPGRPGSTQCFGRYSGFEAGDLRQPLPTRWQCVGMAHVAFVPHYRCASALDLHQIPFHPPGSPKADAKVGAIIKKQPADVYASARTTAPASLVSAHPTAIAANITKMSRNGLFWLKAITNSPLKPLKKFDKNVNNMAILGTFPR